MAASTGQAQLAQLLGVHQLTVWKWEKGRTSPTPHHSEMMRSFARAQEREPGIQYMIRVLTQSSPHMMLGLRLDHGPDATVSITHSTPITVVASASAPVLLVGDTRATSTKLAPWLHPVILTNLALGTTQRFATIEVYELVTPA